MDSAKIFYVYCLFLPWNMEPCYIGKGCGKRTAMHKTLGSGHYNRHLAHIFTKAGASEVPCVMLHEGLDEETAYKYEVALIAAIGRKAHGGPLCNLTDGGEHSATGMRHSDETKRKIGLKHLGKVVSAETRARMSASRTGMKLSDRTRAKMSAYHTGLKRSEEQRKKMSESLKRYHTNRRAADAAGTGAF